MANTAEMMFKAAGEVSPFVTVYDGFRRRRAVAHCTCRRVGACTCMVPRSMCPVLGTFVRIQAGYDDEILNLVPSLVGTRDDATEVARAKSVADWLIRENAPAWMRLAGFGELADELASPASDPEAVLNRLVEKLTYDWFWLFSRGEGYLDAHPSSVSESAVRRSGVNAAWWAARNQRGWPVGPTELAAVAARALARTKTNNVFDKNVFGRGLTLPAASEVCWRSVVGTSAELNQSARELIRALIAA